MTFDFDKAKAALAGNPAATAFMDGNKAALIALGEQAIMQIVNAYLAGNDSAVVTTFWSLDQQAAAMVTGSADVAQRQYDFKQRAFTVAKIAAELIATVLAAGVVL
jgi:hypothetical protein